MKQPGVSLLEFLIYLMLFAFVAMSTSYLLVRANSMVFGQGATSNTMINLYVAHDLLARDLRTASAQKKQWKKITASALIWHAAQKDIGWYQEKDTLIRVEGQYNAEKNVWHKKIKSVVAQPITQVAFNVQGNKVVECVAFVLKSMRSGKEYLVENTVAIRNRKLS